MSKPTNITADLFKSSREFYSMDELHKVMAGHQIVWCWGAHQWTRVLKKALRFSVEGRLFTGQVWITVNGLDLFDVYFSQGKDLKIVHIDRDVFIEDLIETIDKYVETQAR